MVLGCSLCQEPLMNQSPLQQKTQYLWGRQRKKKGQGQGQCQGHSSEAGASETSQAQAQTQERNEESASESRTILTKCGHLFHTTCLRHFMTRGTNICSPRVCRECPMCYKMVYWGECTPIVLNIEPNHELVEMVKNIMNQNDDTNAKLGALKGLLKLKTKDLNATVAKTDKIKAETEEILAEAMKLRTKLSEEPDVYELAERVQNKQDYLKALTERNAALKSMNLYYEERQKNFYRQLKSIVSEVSKGEEDPSPPTDLEGCPIAEPSEIVDDLTSVEMRTSQLCEDISCNLNAFPLECQNELNLRNSSLSHINKNEESNDLPEILNVGTSCAAILPVPSKIDTQQPKRRLGVGPKFQTKENLIERVLQKVRKARYISVPNPEEKEQVKNNSPKSNMDEVNEIGQRIESKTIEKERVKVPISVFKTTKDPNEPLDPRIQRKVDQELEIIRGRLRQRHKAAIQALALKNSSSDTNEKQTEVVTDCVGMTHESEVKGIRAVESDISNLRKRHPWETEKSHANADLDFFGHSFASNQWTWSDKDIRAEAQAQSLKSEVMVNSGNGNGNGKGNNSEEKLKSSQHELPLVDPWTKI